MGKSTYRRLERRQKICVQAFASDLGDAIDIKCIIRDVSKTGCKIVSSQIRDMPDLIQLIVEGIDQPMRGKIVWRCGKTAGMCFEHACSDKIRSNIEALYNSLREDEESGILILGCEDKLHLLSHMSLRHCNTGVFLGEDNSSETDSRVFKPSHRSLV